jgi:hypothetical protein
MTFNDVRVIVLEAMIARLVLDDLARKTNAWGKKMLRSS